MTHRLKAEIWVSAYMRTVRLQGGFAYLARRGSEEAGSVLLKVERPGRMTMVLSPGYGMDGERMWMRATGPEPVSETAADDYIRRRVSTDPDLWVVEVEDQQGRHFLAEPVEGESEN
ncbi:MAG: DUF1491 family protein [Minwuia sp.]|uniref:DUF1491 family protein n=1 Tax=Minwuia sp. TaxID=2493630 RepID=UPI003A8A75A0